ncbi:MAG TPA: serine/threonine-protein kinase [Planctomycetota bacterium]|nr:serine/threonine-protein kinase [Planctomycetota bacterium]
MAPKHEESLVGRTFEKCRIIAKLGMGGMGSVWLAEHFGLGSKVAVKILPPEMGRDPEYVARFMREATTAGRMEHPNIVQIHDVGYAEGRHFIVMQYVDGESLSTVVDNLGAMDPKDAAKIAAGMLRGLQHAHEEGVVHRDVKPDNVLITKGDEPKLLDFGLAIETETALQITKDGMVVGTPYYLAPEQARGQKATPLCDIYAAGVTLYYLLTGKRPFVGATALAVLNKHIHEPPVPPIKHRPVIPKALNDIVLKMMAKKPAERYQSAGAAADDLEAFLKGKPVQVKLPLQLPLPFGMASWTKKQQILAASGAGSLLLLLVLLLVVAFSGGRKEAPSAPSIAQPSRRPGPVEPDDGPRFSACMEFEKQNKESIASFVDILNRYDVFIASTTSAEFGDRARKQRKAFAEFAEKRAEQELDRRAKEPDPYRRVKALQDFPKVLVEVTSIDKRLREDLSIAHGEAENRYLEDERKLDAAGEANRFKEARELIESLIPVAEGPRKDRLLRLKADLPRREKEYDDEILRRLVAAYEPVHDAFVDALTKRETGTAFSLVTKYLRDQSGEAERQRIRVPGLNYELLLKPFPDAALSETQLLARPSIAGVFARAQNSLPFRILADLLDAMDVEYIVREAVQGLDVLARANGEIRLVTLGASGKVTMEITGFQFVPKGGVQKAINYRRFHVQDLFQLTALAEGQTVEQLLATSDQHCRAMGAVWIYTTLPERWAQAGRCFARAEQLGIPGLGFRIEEFRDRGSRELRDRILASRKESGQKNFEGARQMLSAVESAWSHDPVLTEEIGRAMATILVAEVLHHERNRDYARLKQAVRLLRTKYPTLYPEEVVFAPYANALRSTGDWRPTASLLNDDWTWEGKSQGAPCPAEDETKSSRGLKLKPEKPMRVASIRSGGSTGAAVDLALSGASPAFSVGFRFDVSDKEGTYKKLVLRDTGEVALYSFDGREETRLSRESLVKKLSPGQWVELSFVVEGGDLVAYVDQRPLLLKSTTISPNHDFELWTSADANFRNLRLRH